MRLAIVATAVLLLIAVTPARNDHRGGRRRPTSARQVLMRGLIRSICPGCLELIHDDGLATTLAIDQETQIAGSPSPGDRVDILASFTGREYVARSVVKT